MVRTGLDGLLADGGKCLHGRSFGILCNQASITRTGAHIVDALLDGHRANRFRIDCLFGPEHGIWGHAQDMVEVAGSPDARTGLPINSLYGERRRPTSVSLSAIDLLLVDLQDIGSRYYTFIWTMALCMEACAEKDVEMLVLDRPNPIGGSVEGTVTEPGFESFVGLHPLPTRHGLTIGEVANYLKERYYPALKLEIGRLHGWNRRRFFDECGLLWAPPSPNMPSLSTAIVYPGMCLLEGTNLSEGRGTTRPFETFGAPFIDPWSYCERLNSLNLPGVYFGPIQFQPTFHKHAGEICGGAFLHMLDRDSFEPVLTGVAVLQETLRLYPQSFTWRPPPYEYETEKLPFDILAGNSWLRKDLEEMSPLAQIRERMTAECAAFEPVRQMSLLY